MKKNSQKQHLKNVIFVSVTSICLIFTLLSIFLFQNYKFNLSKDVDFFMGKLQIVSDSVSDGYSIPDKYTCNGEDINPNLTIRNLPENTESVALIFDEITNTEKPINHWTVWNINPDIMTIEENVLPIEAEAGMNSFGKIGYTGPCENNSVHEYRFEIFALNTTIDLSPQSTRETLMKEIDPFIIENAELRGTY